MVGTTHFLNACVQHVGLAKVCIMRFCGTATLALPPFSDMPTDLMGVIGSRHFLLSGRVKKYGSSTFKCLRMLQYKYFMSLNYLLRYVLNLCIQGTIISFLPDPEKAYL